MLTQPLQESVVAYGKWVMKPWLISVSKKIDKFNITVDVAPLPIKPPNARDKWFTQAVIEAGVACASKLIQINKFCCHQQVLFVSDVLDAVGRALDKQYLKC
jgi:hypothetical protein